VDWTPRYVDERELFPEELSGAPWLPPEAWNPVDMGPEG
jgi:toluene monooxygenase system protein A